MRRDRIRYSNNYPTQNRFSTATAIAVPLGAGCRNGTGVDRACADHRYARLSGARLNAGTQSRDPPTPPSGGMYGRLEGDRPAW